MSQCGNVQEELTVEWNQLQATWQDSQSVWKDAVASQFEKRFMSPFEAEIPAYLSTLETLRDELQTAWRELH
jgi:hypothetical protein